jgi:hypothetical protein
LGEFLNVGELQKPAYGMTILCDVQQDAPNFTKVMEDCHQSYMQDTQGKKGRNRKSVDFNVM